MCRVVLALLAGALVAAVLAAPGAASSPWDPLTTLAPQQVTIHIDPAVNNREVVPDGNVAVIPGIRVVLTIVSTSREFHTFTIPRLHVNVMVAPGSLSHPHMTRVSFVAHQVGSYAWYCELCPAVHHKGGMGGRVYALVGA